MIYQTLGTLGVLSIYLDLYLVPELSFKFKRVKMKQLLVLSVVNEVSHL